MAEPLFPYKGQYLQLAAICGFLRPWLHGMDFDKLTTRVKATKTTSASLSDWFAAVENKVALYDSQLQSLTLLLDKSES